MKTQTFSPFEDAPRGSGDAAAGQPTPVSSVDVVVAEVVLEVAFEAGEAHLMRPASDDRASSPNLFEVPGVGTTR